MKVGKKADFHWSNYFAPTPVNLQYWTEGIQGILVLIAGDQFFINDKPEFAFYLMLAAGVLDKVSRFFARAANDYKESITVEFPASMSEDVKVTSEIKHPEAE